VARKKRSTSRTPPLGRPSKYHSTYCPRMAEIMSGAGMTEKDIAEKMGVAESTLSKWKIDHPEFAEAITRGREKPNQMVQGALLKKALGYDAEEFTQQRNAEGAIVRTWMYRKHISPDTGAIVFYLINRLPDLWRDKKEITHSMPDDSLQQFAEALREFRIGNHPDKG
jgi:transcriptional regulator with XRE-family HTH domain